jgi:hypothetical protein
VTPAPVKVDKLTLGSETYSDVSIRRKDATRATLQHAGGVATVAVADLPAEVRRSLGEAAEPPAAAVPQAGPATAEAAGAGPGPIEGAFGLKLGAVFDPKRAVKVRYGEDGRPMYEIKPDKPFRFFIGYQVMITEKEHRIYSIGGGGPVKSLAEGRTEAAFLLELLESKYGPADPPDPARPGLRSIESGARNITISGASSEALSVSVFYTDADLCVQAERERQARAAGEAGKAGL